MDADTDCERLPLQGLDLRSMIVLLLLDRGRPISVAELVVLIRRSGCEFQGRPAKVIADALRWEVRRGRVVRLGRGVYGPGVVAKATKHRMRVRVAARRNRRIVAAGAASLRRCPPG